MTDTSQPFDEFPYLALPIECTAPERLAMASLFHGGPRTSPQTARVLELGCANGANLLPMAWYRRDATFVGIDGSARQVETAEQCRKQLNLDNLRFIHADFQSASERLEGQFDFIMAHGVVSWVTDQARDALFKLCKERLAPGGLLYLNYNARPGWNIRGLVREFLLKHTANAGDLQARAEMCKELSARVIAPLSDIGHHYTQLMAHEFHIVSHANPAYLAHEYLAPMNVAWWRSDFMEMARQYDFDYVADADFNSITNRSTTLLTEMMSEQGLSEESVADSIDLLCYQQMHSPIMTQSGFERRELDETEFSTLLLAANLSPAGSPNFNDPAGQVVEVTDSKIREALVKLWSQWPRARSIGELFSDPEKSRSDIEYLTRMNLVEMRCVEPGDFDIDPEPLNALEAEMRGHITSPYHSISPVEKD